MKYFSFIILLTTLVSCGTTGSIKLYDFNAPKYDVEKEILNVINKDSAHTVPRKWIEGTKLDYLERFYVYYNGNPEEMYEISFSDSASWKYASTSRLAIISQFHYGNGWKYERDLSSKEIERITKRFEETILYKMKYGYSKVD